MIPETIASCLHHCSKTNSLRYGLALHALVIKSGLLSDIVFSNHILNMYAKCRKITVARQVFDEMRDKNLVSWSAMISGYEQGGYPVKALDLFSQVLFVPNEFVYSSAIRACAAARAVMLARQIHGQVLKVGCASVSFVSNSLITMYMKSSLCDDALCVHLNSVGGRNVVSYNALIAGFVENGKFGKGYQVFRVMYREGLVPDRFTFVGVLGTCAGVSELWRGVVLHCLTIKYGLDYTALIGNVLITMYSKFDKIEEAEKVFRSIEEKDAISWNTVLAVCSDSSNYTKALMVFKEMIEDCGVRPDEFTFSSVLAASAGLATIRHGKQIHGHLIRLELCQEIGVSNALVSMYAKCGSIWYAYEIFNKMIFKNLVSWNTIISGFANHGFGRRALELFEEMKEAGLKPDSFTFVGILTACNHAGLVEEGEFYFRSMEQTYGISPSVEHVTCFIDLLGRAGSLHEAEEYLRKCQFENNPIVLGSLLSACRLHGSVVIGQRLAQQLLELQPVSSSPYVLLSNLYATDKIWEGTADARKLLKGSGLKKEPGYSRIDVGGISEIFTIGDFSHPKINQIKDTLNILSWAAGQDLLKV